MIEEMFQDVADFLFSTGGLTELALIKFSLWLLIFFTIFKGAEKVFKENRAVPMLISAIISFVGIRFMPDEWFQNIMGVYTIVVGIALFLGPYIIISILSDAARLGRTIKWILVVIAYGSLIYILPSLGLMEFGSESLDSIMRYAADNRPIAAVAVGVILVLLIMWRRHLYRGAGYGARGTRSFFGWVGRRGIGGMRSVGRGAGYLYDRTAFAAGAGIGAGSAYVGRRFTVRRRWLRRLLYGRRQRRAARQARQGIMRGNGEGI